MSTLGPIVTTAQAQACGLTYEQLRTLLRRGQWPRPYPGVLLVDADLHDEVPLRAQVRAGQLLHGNEAVAVLETAARLWDIEGVRPWDGRTIDLAVSSPRGRHQRDGIMVHFWKMGADDVAALDGLRFTTAGRTVLDLALRLPRERAVSVIDSHCTRS